jgi:hypothetical protein
VTLTASDVAGLIKFCDTVIAKSNSDDYYVADSYALNYEKGYIPKWQDFTDPVSQNELTFLVDHPNMIFPYFDIRYIKKNRHETVIMTYGRALSKTNIFKFDSGSAFEKGIQYLREVMVMASEELKRRDSRYPCAGIEMPCQGASQSVFLVKAFMLACLNVVDKHFEIIFCILFTFSWNQFTRNIPVINDYSGVGLAHLARNSNTWQSVYSLRHIIIIRPMGKSKNRIN